MSAAAAASRRVPQAPEGRDARFVAARSARVMLLATSWCLLNVPSAASGEPKCGIEHVDCFDLQQASAAPESLRSSAGRQAVHTFYQRCGYWILRGALDVVAVESLASAAQRTEKEAATGRCLRSFTKVPLSSPWRSAVSDLFETLHATLPGLMATPGEVLHSTLMVAPPQPGGQDQEPHFDHHREAGRGHGDGEGISLMTGWVPLQRLLSDRHAPLELWPGSHLGDQDAHLQSSGQQRSLRLGPQLELGDAVFHDYALMHRGTRNDEGHDRNILMVDFCGGACSASHPLLPQARSWGVLFNTELYHPAA
jgi:hypothetical protein